MAIFNVFSHINGILMAFLCFLMACEYDSGCAFDRRKLRYGQIKIAIVIPSADNAYLVYVTCNVPEY